MNKLQLHVLVCSFIGLSAALHAAPTASLTGVGLENLTQVRAEQTDTQKNVATTTSSKNPVKAVTTKGSTAKGSTATNKPVASTKAMQKAAASSKSTTEEKRSDVVKPIKVQGWSLTQLNDAQWNEGDATEGRAPVFAKLQVLLTRHHASTGPIDGALTDKESLKEGKNNTVKALSAYQTMNNLSVTGVLDQATWDSLNADNPSPAFIEYQLTENDLKQPYAASIPTDYAEQAKMKGLYYTRVTEMLGEKFHMDENFLKQLNPKATFKKVGETIIVADASNRLPDDIHLIIAHKPAKQLYLFDSQNKMIASFPATIGSSDTPSPSGTYTIKGIAANPWYSYNPKNFVQGKNDKPLQLPPGPNNPVGSTWIGLSKPSFGIHGTPNPSSISKNASHGCIRLTNWDAKNLAERVKVGMTVKFLELDQQTKVADDHTRTSNPTLNQKNTTSSKQTKKISNENSSL